MKKIFNYTVLLLSAFLMTLTGCKQEPLTFDHELQQMPSKADSILLEFIAPAGTAQDEVISIMGAFNGGEKYALGKTQNSRKWYIYLSENDFVDGKTLADGFTFFSNKSGKLYTAKGEPDTLSLSGAKQGAWYNIWGMRWEASFKEPLIPGEYAHLYVLGQVVGTDWDPEAPLEMEMVGTDIFRAELSFEAATAYFAFCTEYGDWETVNANRWAGAANDLLEEGAAVALVKGEGCVTIPAGTYVITVNMAKKIVYIGTEEPIEGDKFPTFEHDGDAIFVCNLAGWDTCALYAWGTEIPELFGGWPGAAPKHVVEYKNNTWYAFDCGASNAGLFYHFIANNNGGGKQVEPLCEYELGTKGIKYIVIYDDLSCEEVADPDEVPAGEPKPEPDPEPGRVDTVIITVHDTITTRLFFVDETTENKHSVYSWGNDNEGNNQQIFGGWPGVKWTTWKQVTFLGKTFYYYEFDAPQGQAINIIVNGDGEGNQYNAFAFKVGEKTDVFYAIGDTEATELTPAEAELLKLRSLFLF